MPGAIADIDGDGKPDLVLVSSSLGEPLAAILWGNGDGTFQAPVMLTLSHVYGTVKLADVNGDGRPDLVLSDGVGIAVIESQPGRTFAQEDHYLAGSSIATFSLADVNGDGYPDLVAADNHGTTVAVLLNQPNGIPPGGEHLVAALTVAPEPTAFGQAAIVTLKLTGASGGPSPTGTVSFSVDGALAGSLAVAAGVASLQLSSTHSSGAHTVSAAIAAIRPMALRSTSCNTQSARLSIRRPRRLRQRQPQRSPARPFACWRPSPALEASLAEL